MRKAGAEVCITASHHESGGTARLAEVVRRLGFGIINSLPIFNVMSPSFYRRLLTWPK